ncbi:hypothetical protein EG352_07390 [Chryseobacterium indologenes]|uniref:Uncharacterized protein n=1 Tax=Chryseobacterium indologenes TaxID=253 RepID=A0AAD0YUV9_CHRID|nr:hypothetical protein [Chryseobacterium indologenes]AZB17602.1 hypothetical protein EG352_07390 [Chryseobacterium indologenes]
MNIQVNGQSFNYDKLIEVAKVIDPINYLDIVHDHILSGKSLKSLKYDYLTVNKYDTTIFEGVEKVCNLCNKILPIAMFTLRIQNGRTYTGNQCKTCLSKRNSEQRKHKCKTDEVYRAKFLEYNKKRRSSPDYKEYQKEYQKEYYSKKNKFIRAEKRKNDLEYKAKNTEYQRKYRAKKKMISTEIPL